MFDYFRNCSQAMPIIVSSCCEDSPTKAVKAYLNASMKLQGIRYNW